MMPHGQLFIHVATKCPACGQMAPVEQKIETITCPCGFTAQKEYLRGFWDGYQRALDEISRTSGFKNLQLCEMYERPKPPPTKASSDGKPGNP
jgi:hypothetical protein